MMTDHAKILWKMMAASEAHRGACQDCGETDEVLFHVEAFEVTGRLLCGLCAEAALDDETLQPETEQ